MPNSQTSDRGEVHTGYPSVETRVEVDRVKQLYARAPIGLIATAFNAGFITIVLWDLVLPGRAVGWLLCQLGSVSVRYVVYLRFCRSRPSSSGEVTKWVRWFRMGALLSGMLWGAVAVFLFPYGSLPHQIFLAFVLGGMVAGASGLYALDLRSFAAYTIPSIVPVCLQLLTGGEALHLAMGGMVVLFALLMGWLAVQNHRSILTALRLSTENTELIASLTLAKDRAERLNLDLSEEVEERERAEQKLRQHRAHLEELVEQRAQGLAAANMQLLEVITQHEQTERQASRVAREWTSTFDQMRDMIAIVSPDLKVTRANAALAQSASLSHPRELIGKSCDEIFRCSGATGPECPHREALRTHALAMRDIQDPRDGSLFHITCSPFTNEAGAVIGMVHVARDISEQKHAQQKREELISQLQQAVANVKLLSGLLPICSSCKKIRDDQGYWTQLEKYIMDHSEADFTHGICPDCTERLYPGYGRREPPRG